jgi:hypothetical protein
LFISTQGFWIKELDTTPENPVLRATILYNQTLTLGDDLPLWFDLLADAFLRMISVNESTLTLGLEPFFFFVRLHFLH